ncbi:MAG: hypothetical protein WC683_05790 [bacterium]
MYPTKIISMAKNLLGENIVANRYDADQLMQFFNEAQKNLVAEARSMFPLLGRISTTVTQTAGTETTSLPDFHESLLLLRDSTQDVSVADHLYPVHWADQAGSGFAVADNELLWVRNDQTQVWTLWYTRAPWDCHKGVATAETDITSTSIILDDTASALEGECYYGDMFDDYYNGAKVVVTDCTTAAKEFQQPVITDYAGTTRTATIAAWPGGTPDGTVTYEIQPMLDPMRWADLMAWELNLRINSIARDDPAVYSKRHPYGQQRNQFRSHWRGLQRRMRPSIHMVSYDRQ